MTDIAVEQWLQINNFSLEEFKNYDISTKSSIIREYLKAYPDKINKNDLSDIFKTYIYGIDNININNIQNYLQEENEFLNELNKDAIIKNNPNFQAIYNNKINIRNIEYIQNDDDLTDAEVDLLSETFCWKSDNELKFNKEFKEPFKKSHNTIDTNYINQYKTEKKEYVRKLIKTGQMKIDDNFKQKFDNQRKIKQQNNEYYYPNPENGMEGGFLVLGVMILLSSMCTTITAVAVAALPAAAPVIITFTAIGAAVICGYFITQAIKVKLQQNRITKKTKELQNEKQPLKQIALANEITNLNTNAFKSNIFYTKKRLNNNLKTTVKTIKNLASEPATKLQCLMDTINNSKEVCLNGTFMTSKFESVKLLTNTIIDCMEELVKDKSKSLQEKEIVLKEIEKMQKELEAKQKQLETKTIIFGKKTCEKYKAKIKQNQNKIKKQIRALQKDISIAKETTTQEKSNTQENTQKRPESQQTTLNNELKQSSGAKRFLAETSMNNNAVNVADIHL